MGFLDCDKLPGGDSTEFNIVQPIWRRIRRLIVHVRAKQTIFFREPMIDSGGKKVFVDHLLAREREQTEISVAIRNWVLGDRKKRQVSCCAWIDGYGSVGQYPVVRIF